MYQECKRIRSKSSVYNCALVSNKFDDDFVEMHYANLMSVAQGSLKSQEAQEKHIKSGLEEQELKETYTLKVPARTLESILDDFGHLPPIDFISLDVEGYELEVLLGLNLEKYQPKYILVEANFADEINSCLQPFYELVEQMTYHDFLYRVKK